ncbi:CPBP family intramembrane glutamic endopeptidase [Propionibacterium acidifaciens]
MSTARPPMGPAYPPAGPAHPPTAPAYPFQQSHESALPVLPTRYHGLWHSPRWRVWRPVVGTLVGGVLWFAASTVAFVVAMVIDVASGRSTAEEYYPSLAGGGGFTPALFIANNVGLACSIPIVWLVARLHGQPIGFVHSVIGRFRWRWFGWCLAVLLPIWIVFTVADAFLEGGGLDGLAVNGDTVVLILGILLTTPLQCAGEEWFFRGGINRLVAGCFPQRTKTLGIVSALVGGAVSSFCFMLAHMAQDPWLNIGYFCFGAAACLLCYCTGGLEASTAMHIINNMTAMALMPFSDISHMMDRSEGTGSPWSLLQLAVIAIAAALICRRARARGLDVVSGPEPAPAPGPWPQAVMTGAWPSSDPASFPPPAAYPPPAPSPLQGVPPVPPTVDGAGAPQVEPPR